MIKMNVVMMKGYEIVLNNGVCVSIQCMRTGKMQRTSMYFDLI